MNLALPVGLVINLNDPSGSYYISKDEFKKEDILHFKYHKIGCCGLDAISNNMAVNEFVYQVIHFKSIPQYSEQHILVHCTHGHNCIGYMIVHYLMRTQFTSVTEVGLVIDLNDLSSSYYISKDEFKKESILHFKYHKIGCCGLDAIPSNMAVNEFVYQVWFFDMLLSFLYTLCIHLFFSMLSGSDRTSNRSCEWFKGRGPTEIKP
ncbi:hypothetical protein LINPERHAP2_LOCUS25037 [Linum perenne]